MSENPAHYSGEFVLTKNGSLDFGEIPDDIARIIKRQAGKIRLRIGKQVNGEKDNYGEVHINRESRLNQLNAIGYADARAANDRYFKNKKRLWKRPQPLEQ